MKKRLLTIILAITILTSIIPYENVRAENNITFDQGLIEWSYPENNQGTIDEDKVERNPLIQIQFKHNIELINPNKITLTSDGHIYSVDMNNDTWITYDGDTLKIDINSLHRSGESPLRANAAYKLTIEKGALRLTKEKIENEEINLYFITGEKLEAADGGLRPMRYTSDEDYNHDNITNLNTTKLGVDGSIYIHFHSDSDFPRELKWNQWTANPKVITDEDALQYFKLYKEPKAYKESPELDEELYHSELRYDEFGRSIPINELEDIPLKSVEIVEDTNGNKTNILKITPEDNLIPYNKYIIKLTQRDVLTDNYEKIMRANDTLVTTGQEIWTAPLANGQPPKWEMDKISPEEIIEVYRGPYKIYTIHGAQKYNQHIDTENSKPITLYADKEVVLNPHISNPLNGITLFEGYGDGDTSTQIRKIKWYKLEYFFEEGVKKTKISLYPEGELHVGRYYELNISDTVFRSRNDENLPSISLNFVIQGDGLKQRGIYRFEVTNKEGIIAPINRPLLITDFTSGKNDLNFNITGYNFAEDIKQLRFVRVTDGKTITIPSTDLKFHHVTKITGKISGNAKRELAKVIDNENCGFTTSNAGIYNIYIDFERGSSAALTTITQRFIVKDRPKVISTTPFNGENHFDPEILYKEFTDPEESGYYLKVVFEDIGASLDLRNILSHGIQVKVQGEGDNLVDNTKPLRFEKEQPISRYTTTNFNLYIPLLEKLNDGQDYEVLIPEGSVVEYTDVTTGGNRCYTWTFNTNYFPKGDRLYQGSAPQFYNWNYPIVIEGDMFHYDSTVRFRSMNGRNYHPSRIDVKDDKTLYIYLPRNPRLAIGLYDIIISNGTNYETEMVYGVFSVVEQGDYIPNEEYRVKDKSSIGRVKEIINTSKDILDLNPRQSNRINLEINLDELMGSETWVRSIEYPASWRDNLDTLVLKSKWANTTIENLRLHNHIDERYIELRIGRVEASMGDILKNRLVGYNIKSNFIEVSGANFDFSSLIIEIPYFQSDGNGLKMLRYDETTRKFESIPFIVNYVDGKLTTYTNKPGIFVIVE